MTEPHAPASPFSRRTVWAWSPETPLRRFLRTETGSAAVLLAATLAALAWANIDPAGHEPCSARSASPGTYLDQPQPRTPEHPHCPLAGTLYFRPVSRL